MIRDNFMKLIAPLLSFLLHLIAAIVMAVAGVWYGVVTFGLSTPQWIYNLIGAGIPMPALGVGFLLLFAACVLIAKAGFKVSSADCPVRRSGGWLFYGLGSLAMFLMGMWLTTLNPMLDVPPPVANAVITGTPIEIFSGLLCLLAAALFLICNKFLAR
jgi:hypothetical protein